MDEFIKREDALNAIKAIRSVCGCSAIDRDDAENAIMDCPTSDVAPKGEVHDDHHKQATCYALGCQEGDKIKQEVAREIFKEIDKAVERLYHGYKIRLDNSALEIMCKRIFRTAIVTTKNEIDTIKKKYTEERI